MKNLLARFVSAIDAEIALIDNEGRDQAYELLSGQRDEKPTSTLYVFLLADTMRIPEDASGTLRMDGADAAALVVSQEGNRVWLLLESPEPLPPYIPSARLVVNQTELLKRLKEKINALRESSNHGLAPKVFGLQSSLVSVDSELPRNVASRIAPTSKQTIDVIRQCVGSEITFLWGPPGTGKTFTIAALVASLAGVRSNETVLVTSHTHAAVEQALWALIEPPSDNREAGFLHDSALVDSGRVLKVGPLKSDKITRMVSLDSYTEEKAKQRGEDIKTLEEERVRAGRLCEASQQQLGPWKDLRDAKAVHDEAATRAKRYSEMWDSSRAVVESALARLEDCEQMKARAERSFFIGRGGRVKTALDAIGTATRNLAEANASAGTAQARLLRQQTFVENSRARLREAEQHTCELKPAHELESEIQSLNGKIATLGSEIEALRASAGDDAKSLVRNAIVLFATLTKLYVDRQLLPDMMWDTVIIDEASMAMPPLLAYAASRARKRVVIVGDMYQLPPVVLSAANSAGELLGRDVFDLREITAAVDSGRAFPSLAKLREQHRMHPDIAAVAKELITGYRDLSDANEVLARTPPAFVSALGTDKALVVVDTANLHPWSAKMPGSLSRFNFVSGQVCIDLAAMYAASFQEPQEKDPPKIGIVTPYAAQRRYLNQLIKTLHLERWAMAGTVHTFQGSECDVIIFDSVVGEPHWTARFTNPSDWQQVRRDLNVAVTRARHQFVFVGDVRWLTRHAQAGSGYGKLWGVLKDRAAILDVNNLLGEGFKSRVAKMSASAKGWNLVDTETARVTFLTESDFYHCFAADLAQAKNRVILYTPFIGKTRWPSVAPQIAWLRERSIEVFLLHKPLSDPEWRRFDVNFGRQVFDSLTALRVKLIPMSGVHAKTIVIDSRIVYEGSLNWASQTSSYEHMWRFDNKDMAALIEKMLQLKPVVEAYGGKSGSECCPKCGAGLIFINQAQQSRADPHPFKLGCSQWADNKGCEGYLRRVDGRAPFLKPPTCPLGATMSLYNTKNGRPWAWKCGHKTCSSIRWARGDCEG